MKNKTSHNPYIKYGYNFASSGFSFDRALVKYLSELKNKMGANIKVLDFGCGMKPFAYIFEGVSEYKGIDVYPGEFVDVVYDGKEIPFPDEYFDIIFSTSVLEHVENLNMSLQEISRILKKDGTFVSVVPFINHVHGAPFDFHRPTRFGWQSFLQKNFSTSQVTPVDNRWQCVMNVLTSAINNTVYGMLRNIRNGLQNNEVKKNIHSGDASPESKKKLGMIYFIMKLNPINFVLGLFALFMSIFPKPNSAEGEITSGYLIVATKS
ncbi:MAG: class I SAM-dependent methyltransferase [Pseudomonadota bacterium]